MLKAKGYKKIFHANKNPNKSGVILIWNKMEFKSKTVARDKENHYIMIKGSTHQEDITMANIYTSNNAAPTYVKQKLIDLKEEMQNKTIRYFPIPFSETDRSTRQKINKEMLDFNHTLDQKGLTDIQFIQKWQNIHSSQVHKKHSLG